MAVYQARHDERAARINDIICSILPREIASRSYPFDTAVDPRHGRIGQ
jgi:hypothetical protein